MREKQRLILNKTDSYSLKSRDLSKSCVCASYRPERPIDSNSILILAVRLIASRYVGNATCPVNCCIKLQRAIKSLDWRQTDCCRSLLIDGVLTYIRIREQQCGIGGRTYSRVPSMLRHRSFPAISHSRASNTP